TYAFFDKFLKGDANGRIEKMSKVTYYTMGSNKWQTSDTWPPAAAQPMTFHLASGGHAHSLRGDGPPGGRAAPPPRTVVTPSWSPRRPTPTRRTRSPTTR